MKSERDPLLDHPAVKMYRDTFSFCPNAGFRRDIVVTVNDLDLWHSVLENWGWWKGEKWKPKNPLNVKGMLDQYEYEKRCHAAPPSCDTRPEHPVKESRGKSVWWWQRDRVLP